MAYQLPKCQSTVRIAASTMLGFRIHQARKQLKWSAATLGQRANLSENLIKRLESGSVAKPDIFEIAAISRAVGYTLDQFMRDIPQTEAELALTLIRQRPELIRELASK